MFMWIIIIEILILLTLTPCSFVSCYRVIGGTSCLNMKVEGSFDGVSHQLNYTAS